ncbi:unnamed protein product [Ilex paraguariensis]|uniref:Apple domain-containing protein n=1 Tax=Ilex paraguariensis TaxID=185542 RepID=A0ABC8RVD8_9AQUA
MTIGIWIVVLRKKTNKEEDEEDYMDQVSGRPMRFSYEELKTATGNFQKKLREGGVYSGINGDIAEPVDLFADFLSACDYPNVCGNFGLCVNGQCSCPSGFRADVSNDQIYNGCVEISPTTCTDPRSHGFLPLADVYYFNYVDNDAVVLKGTNVESCIEACLKNCSCKAALFRYFNYVSHGDCFLPSPVFSLISDGKERNVYQSSAFIKISKDTANVAGTSASLGRSGIIAGSISGAGSSTSPGRIGIIAGSISGALAITLMTIGILIVFFRKKTNMEEDEEDYMDQVSGMPMRFSYEELKIATGNFQKKLGEGGFGSVFEGILSDGERIAVKRLDGLGQVCGRKNLDRSQPEEFMHLLSMFMKQAKEDQLIDMVDKNSDDMNSNISEVIQMMRLAVWCLQRDFTCRPAMSMVVKVIEGLMDIESALDYSLSDSSTMVAMKREAALGTTVTLLPSILSGPR